MLYIVEGQKKGRDLVQFSKDEVNLGGQNERRGDSKAFAHCEPPKVKTCLFLLVLRKGSGKLAGKRSQGKDALPAPAGPPFPPDVSLCIPGAAMFKPTERQSSGQKSVIRAAAF
jgi:hypothetical protein